MAPLITFAFGPDDSYYFNCPTGSYWTRIPMALEEMLKGRIPVNPHHLCIGPDYNGYAAFYVAKMGTVGYSMNYRSNPIIQPVVEWLLASWKKGPDDMALQSRLVLGPSRGVLAFTPNGRYGHPVSTVSRTLQEAMSWSDGLGLKEAALGFDGAWWLQVQDKTCKWDFAGHYPELEAALKPGGPVDPSSITSLALDPENPRHYFLVYDRKKVRYSLPQEFVKHIAPLLREYHDNMQTVSGVFEGYGSTKPAAANTAGKGRDDDQPPAYDVKGEKS